MRKIKFRAWCDICQSFQPIMGIIHQDDNGIAIYCPMHEGGVIECKVMQSTGLKDANDNDIYEKDIVTCLQAKNDWKGKLYINIVEWNEDRFRLNRYSAAWYSWSDMEVIGNIYENPELLK